jgi:inosine-uridine nucleoside N-ribohydrolase
MPATTIEVHAMRRKVILDVDPGRDDAVAIMLAALSPEIDLLGVSVTHGNRPLNVTVPNALRVVNWLKLDIPVYRGAEEPLLSFIDPQRRDPKWIYDLIETIEGSDLDLPATTSQPQDQHAVSWLIETLMSSNGDIVLCPVGPMTNIALAIRMEPRIVEKIEEMIFMGGAVGPGNISPCAEFNVWKDPEAARIVLNAGIKKVTMVPLDATHSAHITRDECQALIDLGTRGGEGAGKLAMRRIARGTELGSKMEAGPIHDALVVCAVLDPSVLQQVHHTPLDVIVNPGGKDDGQTVVDLRPGDWAKAPSNAQVALSADREKFVQMLTEILSLE